MIVFMVRVATALPTVVLAREREENARKQDEDAYKDKKTGEVLIAKCVMVFPRENHAQPQHEHGRIQICW